MKKILLAAVLLAGCARAPNIPIEDPPADESPFVLTCKLETDMEPDIVVERCGQPYSKWYAPDFEDAVGWRYCAKKADGTLATACRRMYGLVFYNGKLLRWGRIYEVVQ